MKKPMSVDEYITSFPEVIRSILTKMRTIVMENAPSAVEYFSYGMPGYKLGGRPLIYFAAFKNHIGVYPTPSGVAAFKRELSIYKQAKGSIQLPLSDPIPYDLFTKIVQYRVKENLALHKS
jgi:uncharacterized protein YdhG (YjbR/CyaY superfamily)